MIGESVGRYHILERLGEGGMAVVYKAFDTRLQRNVALKMILPGQQQSEKFLARFEQEAKALASLSHPHIVKVLDYGDHEGVPYLVMEYMPGGTLKQKLGGIPVEPQGAAGRLAPIAAALDYAHRQGIVHRDVKPANILITHSGEPMLSDFGVAKILENQGTTLDLTGAGVGIGTPEYMAPEQGLGHGVDGRADIYALGIVFYEMVTGRRPYEADTPMAVLLKKTTEPLPRPTSFVPELPEYVEQVLLKALQKDPVRRYQSMQELAAALADIAQGRVGEVEEKRWLRLSPAFLAGGAVLGLCCIALVAALAFRGPLSDLIAGAPPPTLDFGTLEPSPHATITLAMTVAPPPTSPTVAAPPGDQVLVPAGEFLMGGGSNDSQAGADERPQHITFLYSYYIDAIEVSNALYDACVQTGVCQPPETSAPYTPPDYFGNPEFDHHPVINVTWEMAEAYCEWRGARLPTEAEWEKAARGSEGRLYPWGNGENGSIVNFCDTNCPISWAAQEYDDGYAETAPVEAYPEGATGRGVYNLSGNVWEWTADWYADGYYQNAPYVNPQGPASGEGRVIRGGSWGDVLGHKRASKRQEWDPQRPYSTVGFRCARDAAAPPSPAEFLQGYYAALSNDYIGEAWEMLSLDFAQVNDPDNPVKPTYQGYADWFGNQVQTITALDTQVLSQDATSAELCVQTGYVMGDGTVDNNDLDQYWLIFDYPRGSWLIDKYKLVSGTGGTNGQCSSG